MILITCDGRTLTARRVGRVTFQLTADRIPIKMNGSHLVEDDLASKLLRELVDSRLYAGGRVEE